MRLMIFGWVLAGLVVLLVGCVSTFVPVTRGCWEFKEPADASTRNYRLVGLCYDAPGASETAGFSLIPVVPK